MAVINNLQHAQVAPIPVSPASPVFVDVPGVVSFETTVTTDSTATQADGQVYLTTYAAPEGSFTLSWIDSSFPVLVVINGGVASTTGTAGTKIDRYEQPGAYVAPAFILSDWNPNVDHGHSPNVAGFRTTLPNATASVASKSSGQDSVHEWSVDGAFTAIAPAPMFIYEAFATAPAFTSGVQTVNLNPPS